MIEAEHLAKAYGRVAAADDVVFKVEPGTIVGLLGLNGAGKSTTMRLLCGALVPDRGSARIAGHCVATDRRRALANVGYLPEAAQGFQDLSPREFLASIGGTRGLGAKQCAEATERYAADLNLTAHLDSQLGNLSKGWRQRAWLAQAMLHDPAALVLDEPTDGLDPAEKVSMRAFLRRIAADKAILVSTHILEEAEALCDRIVVMARGRVVADARLDALIAQHGSLATAFAKLAVAAPPAPT